MNPREVSEEVLSLWELAGYDMTRLGDYDYRPDPDAVFKPRINDLHNTRASTTTRVASVLAWTHLREDRAFRNYQVGKGYTDAADHAEAGVDEHMAYAEEMDAARSEIESNYRARLARGDLRSRAEKVRQHELNEADFWIRPKRPEAPGAAVKNRLPGWSRALLSMAGAGVLVVVFWLVCGLALQEDVAGPIARWLSSSLWWSIPGSLGLFVYGSTKFFAMSRPGLGAEAEESYKPNAVLRRVGFDPYVLDSDARHSWPIGVWWLSVLLALTALPLWVTAVYIPVSAVVPLLVFPRLRRRLVASTRGGRPMRLLGDSRWADNIFVQEGSSVRSEGPVIATALPLRLRTGDGVHSVEATQGAVRDVAEHSGVESDGLLSTDAGKVTGAILLDVVAAATGCTNMKLVGAFGNGMVHVVSKAVALATGNDCLISATPEAVKPGLAVADWWEREAAAYLEFAEKHLSREDAATALLNAAEVLDGVRELDIPDLARVRLETLVYSLKRAAFAACDASAAS